MITEDYVSFETAKLLKEKEFDEICSYIWGITHIDKSYVLQKWIITNGQIKNSDLTDGAYTAPTQSLALKWLREVHRIEIYIVLSELNADNSRKYMFDIYSSDINRGFDSVQKEEFNSYEEAVEAALKYTLENLI